MLEIELKFKKTRMFKIFSYWIFIHLRLYILHGHYGNLASQVCNRGTQNLNMHVYGLYDKKGSSLYFGSKLGHLIEI